MRVVSWNMNKRRSDGWNWLINDLRPDYIMAQEASPLPDNIIATERTTTKKTNRTVFYSKTNTHVRLKVSSDNGMGIIVSKDQDIFFLTIYANLDFNPVDPPLLGYIAAYVSHIRRRENAEHIIIAGDFNMDRRMDENPTGSKFAAKDTYPTNSFFDAIEDMGFYECIRKFHKEPIQTHWNNKSTFPWELDHMFVTSALFGSLTSMEILDANKFSDHNALVVDFNFKKYK